MRAMSRNQTRLENARKLSVCSDLSNESKAELLSIAESLLAMNNNIRAARAQNDTKRPLLLIE